MDKNTLFSSFGKWLSPISLKLFSEHVQNTNQDKYTKKLSSIAYLKLFLHAQLFQRTGLREIADDLLHPSFQKELGLSSISASQLSRKHSQVQPALLERVFYELVQQILKLPAKTPLLRDFRIIDSTTISLCQKYYRWAEFRKTKAGIKLHTRIAFVDHDVVCPDQVVMTPAKRSDRTQMDALIQESHMTYVFDRGYLDYQKFDDYCEQGIFFVTRVKKNTIIQPIYTYFLPENSIVTSDELVLIGGSAKRTESILRLVCTTDSIGNPIEILTNRFDLSANEVAEIYRKRWAIETFFKWMKQHVTIQHFYGTNEQAVMNQVWIALIAFCLLVLVKNETKTKHTLFEIYRWLKASCFESVDIWFERIHRKPSRPSKGRRRNPV